jgi:hypothetical protein
MFLYIPVVSEINAPCFMPPGGKLSIFDAFQLKISGNFNLINPKYWEKPTKLMEEPDSPNSCWNIETGLKQH